MACPLTPDEEENERIEKEFGLWALASGLAEKLRTMRMARAQDGEAFAIISTNPRLAHPVTLDLQLVEADQVTTPLKVAKQEQEVDGIVLDRYSNPKTYHVAKNHPGGFAMAADCVNIPADSMIHIFRQERPGQHRGIPEISPALPLFAQLRRFTLAVLSAAEAAADFAGIIYTDAPANGEADSLEPMDRIELHRNMLLTMPGGWKMAQLDPKQPATTYADFKKEILNEIARCLNMPYNVAAGNSSGYNYASGRLDHQTYFKSIRVDQQFTGIRVLDRVLRCWLDEYALEFGELRYRGKALPPHQWFWDGMEHVDPAKEANAAATRMGHGISHPSAEWARLGRDFHNERARAAADFGVTVPEYLALLKAKVFGITPGGLPTGSAGDLADIAEEIRDAGE